MPMGSPEYDIAHLLGGAMLLVSFVMLGQWRAVPLVTALAAQGVLLGAAALWQGHVQGQAHLYVTGVIALAAKAVLIPLLLRRLVAGLPPGLRDEAPGRLAAIMLPGAALVGLAMLVVVPATTGAGIFARLDLAIALAILLLGGLKMAARRSALALVVGLLTIENALILAAVAVSGMPLVVELSLAGLVLVVAVIAGVFAREMGARLDSLDPAILDRHRGEGRR